MMYESKTDITIHISVSNKYLVQTWIWMCKDTAEYQGQQSNTLKAKSFGVEQHI